MERFFISLFCAVFLLSSGGAADVTLVNGTLGRSVLLNTNYEVLANSYIQWDFNGFLTAQYINSSSYCTGELVGRCRVYQNGSLRIDKVSYADEGAYTQKTQLQGSSKITEYELRIYGDPAAFTIVNGTLGKSVLFNTNYKVPANALIQWDFNSVLVAQYFNSSSYCTGALEGRCQVYHNGSLRIDNTSYADEGAYTLTTQTSHAKITNYKLRIYVPLLLDPVLSSNVTSSPVISGTYVTLQCDAGNQTVTAFQFYWGRIAVCTTARGYCRGSFLDFKPVEFETGYYTCTIQNPVSSRSSNTLTMIVFVPVSNVTVTSNGSGLVWPGIDSVSLRCSALGTNVSYSWSLQGRTISTGDRFHLSDNNSTLTISPVSTGDNGAFICTAENEINSQNSSAETLNLAAPVSAVTLTSNTSGTLWAGQDSVSLLCTAQGSAITFSWRQNGNPVSSSPPYYITNSPQYSTLTISPVSKNDNGPFTCTATNRANNITSNGTSLNINWFPNGIIICTAQPSNQIVQLGCSWPEGKPAAHVTLIFNGRQYTSTDQVFTDVNSYDIIYGSNLTCNGDQLGRTSGCVVTFDSPNNGLDGGQIAGIVIGVLAGAAIIGIIVFFILKRRKTTGAAKDSPPANTFETRLPGAWIDTAPPKKEESNH